MTTQSKVPKSRVKYDGSYDKLSVLLPLRSKLNREIQEIKNSFKRIRAREDLNISSEKEKEDFVVVEQEYKIINKKMKLLTKKYQGVRKDRFSIFASSEEMYELENLHEEISKDYSIILREVTRLDRMGAQKEKMQHRAMLARKGSHKRREKFDNSLDGTLSKSITSRYLKELLIGQKHKCNECRTELTRRNMHLDHHIPISKGGLHSIYNVVWLCEKCNLSKSDRMPSGPLTIKII